MIQFSDIEGKWHYLLQWLKEREQWAKHILHSLEKFFDQLMDFAFSHTAICG